MNKDQIKKNLHAHVQLVPPAYRLDKNGLEQRPVSDDDWWLIAAIGDEGVTISDPRTGHVKMLGYDHIYKFTSDEPKNGAKRGFLSLHVQLFVQGNSVSVLPNARPGEPVAPKRVEITDKLVEIGYPTASGIQQRLESHGYHLAWVRPEHVNNLIDIDRWELVVEPDTRGLLSSFHTRDRLVLLKQLRRQ